jgi:hypothetical protein
MIYNSDKEKNMNGHEKELNELNIYGWKGRAYYLANKYIKDVNDIKLLFPNTYDIDMYEIKKIDNMYGEYVRTDDFMILAQRFLLAMELIYEIDTEEI